MVVHQEPNLAGDLLDFILKSKSLFVFLGFRDRNFCITKISNISISTKEILEEFVIDLSSLDPNREVGSNGIKGNE